MFLPYGLHFHCEVLEGLFDEDCIKTVQPLQNHTGNRVSCCIQDRDELKETFLHSMVPVNVSELKNQVCVETSVVSSAWIATNLADFTSSLICSLMTDSMQFKSSFCTVFDVPLKTVAVFQCSSNTSSSDANKSTSPPKMPAWLEPSLSSLPLNANSNRPQNFTQSIRRPRMWRFLLISLL